MRLVSPNGYISFPRCREVGFIQRLYIISTAVRSGLPDGSSSCIIIIIITTTPFDVVGREVGVPWFMMVIWYCTSLVYGMVVYGMEHRWFIWYNTSLVYGMVVHGMVHRWYMVWWYMVWYIVGIWYGISFLYDIVVYGMIHHWFIWYNFIMS